MNKAVQIKTGKVVFMTEEYMKDNSDRYKPYKKPVAKKRVTKKIEDK